MANPPITTPPPQTTPAPPVSTSTTTTTPGPTTSTTTTLPPGGRGPDIIDAINGGRVPPPPRKPKDLLGAAEMPMLLEQLAAIEHDRWADWQRYFMGKLERDAEGRLVIPVAYEDALSALIETPYADLSEELKNADRREVGRYWATIEAFFQRLP